ncbi:MAG: GDP-L-fucose synthase [Candidatus Omnitrophica bacterium]|nr:GDP-L-fucose synthase [Candidatus Omnitrophota bacterium]
MTHLVDWNKGTVCVTGGAGFIGQYLQKGLVARGVEPNRLRVPRSRDHDLTVLENARRAVSGCDLVIHAAAVVGGIHYNQNFPGEVFYRNTLLNAQVLEACRLEQVGRVVCVSSACAYPLKAPVPIREDSLFEGEPEPTNAPYGFAKRMLVVQAQAYRRQYGLNAVSVIPFNAFGPGDDFDPKTSHVIPALIRKCFEEKELIVWGDGSPTRNFLYVEDFAEGILLAAEKLDRPEPVNIGTDEETSIRELVEHVVRETGFKGAVSFDTSKPNGQPKRGADITRAREWLGYEPKHTFVEGLRKTIAWYRETQLGGKK